MTHPWRVNSWCGEGAGLVGRLLRAAPPFWPPLSATSLRAAGEVIKAAAWSSPMAPRVGLHAPELGFLRPAGWPAVVLRVSTCVSSSREGHDGGGGTAPVGCPQHGTSSHSFILSHTRREWKRGGEDSLPYQWVVWWQVTSLLILALQRSPYKDYTLGYHPHGPFAKIKKIK